MLERGKWVNVPYIRSYQSYTFYYIIYKNVYIIKYIINFDN